MGRQTSTELDITIYLRKSSNAVFRKGLQTYIITLIHLYIFKIVTFYFHKKIMLSNISVIYLRHDVK